MAPFCLFFLHSSRSIKLSCFKVFIPERLKYLGDIKAKNLITLIHLMTWQTKMRVVLLWLNVENYRINFFLFFFFLQNERIF